MSTTEPVFPTGIGNPAMRALRAAGYTCLDDLAGVPAAELASLHGVGPKAVRIVQEALERTGRSLS
ncbi:hypothetical protein J2W54_002135 [Rhodococcus fascians]|uniref:helix-hairpin-helix domain-containing protein n=1 Tax=Nocardiaceae TaxID=85025 RepID=UPI002789B033|nr:hypothetical protein [Rhodococcus cercidiphylli]MDQ0280953.1 hypothetical protein [Rhodococcus fascians]MDR6909595.1 hypothetical protein [Rhodococcus sp. 3258]MDR6931759.1 hypothetical protein [Rhodococcus fascians]